MKDKPSDKCPREVVENPTIDRDVLRCSIFAIAGAIVTHNVLLDGGTVGNDHLRLGRAALLRAVELLGYVCPKVNAEMTAKFGEEISLH